MEKKREKLKIKSGYCDNRQPDKKPKNKYCVIL